MKPYSNSEDWKAFRLQTEVSLQLDEKVVISDQHHNLFQGISNSEDLSDFSDDDVEGTPKCNMWKGQNYNLHVLGSFESEFKKRLKTFQVPPTVSISLNPFCRSEFPTDDPPVGEAYLIWKGKETFQKHINMRDCIKTTESQSSDTLAKKLISSSFSPIDSLIAEEEYEDLDNSSDGESETDVDIAQYIEVQRQKKDKGMNLTGETFWYDQDNDVIRNLHAKSISLTNYGTFPDEKNFGNTRLLFDQLTSQEKLMLSPD